MLERPLPAQTQTPLEQFLFVDANHPDKAQADWLERRLSEQPELKLMLDSLRSGGSRGVAR